MTTGMRTVIYVSDGTAITAETLGLGLLAQFQNTEFHPLRFPFINTEVKARECAAHINEIAKQDGLRPIVVMTQTHAEFRTILLAANAMFIDLFGQFITTLEQELGSHYVRAVGHSHGRAHPQYDARIAAMNFVLAHDDGVSDADLENADLILVGVSRSGKTPTSLYLSMQFSLKAANYPLIPEDFERGRLPARLHLYRNKLFGLTISPERLHRIRTERRPDSKYASLENCRYEVAEAERMMRREQIKYFDMTSCSIEEMAVYLRQELQH